MLCLMKQMHQTVFSSTTWSCGIFFAIPLFMNKTLCTTRKDGSIWPKICYATFFIHMCIKMHPDPEKFGKSFLTRKKNKGVHPWIFTKFGHFWTCPFSCMEMFHPYSRL